MLILSQTEVTQVAHVWFGPSDSASLCFIFLILNTDDKYFPSGPLRDCLRTKKSQSGFQMVSVSKPGLPPILDALSLCIDLIGALTD